MPRRRTIRGAARTPLAADADVLVCGASFAGLALARELAGSGARVVMLDRYEIGERQTSACAAPTRWLSALGLDASIRQTFGELVIHVPGRSARYQLPWTFSTFDYQTLCALLAEQSDARFAIATVKGRSKTTVHTDRGDLAAPLVVDALGWRRVLARDGGYQPPDAPLSRGLEVHPSGAGSDLEIWIDRRYVPAGYGWSFPARSELRIGVGSFDPRFHVREPTVALAEDLDRTPERYQGNWIPHRLRPATEDEVFFVGDSAGHCLPLTAEGIRTAFYFAIALGRELRSVVDERATRADALRRYHAFSAAHDWKFRCLLGAQRLVPRVSPRLLRRAIAAMGNPHFVRWSFEHYLQVAPPPSPGAPTAPRRPLRPRLGVGSVSAAGRNA